MCRLTLSHASAETVEGTIALYERVRVASRVRPIGVPNGLPGRNLDRRVLRPFRL